MTIAKAEDVGHQVARPSDRPEVVAARMNHDLNNPLTAIIVVAEVLLRSEDIEPHVRGRVETILAQARKAASVAQDLRSLMLDELAS